MIAARSRTLVERLRDTIRHRTDRFLRDLDAERISSFQSFYYPLVFVAGLYLLVGADAPTTALSDTLGPLVYAGWLILLNMICPVLTLIGRRLYNNAGVKHPLEPNHAYGGAWLMLCGDAGVWAAILIYVACVANTTYWGQALYPTFYLLMGIPGGAMFTLRSVRRLKQIRRREARL